MCGSSSTGSVDGGDHQEAHILRYWINPARRGGAWRSCRARTRRPGASWSGKRHRSMGLYFAPGNVRWWGQWREVPGGWQTASRPTVASSGPVGQHGQIAIRTLDNRLGWIDFSIDDRALLYFGSWHRDTSNWTPGNAPWIYHSTIVDVLRVAAFAYNSRRLIEKRTY